MIGGVYSVFETAVGLTLSGVDARRSNSNTMWLSETTYSYSNYDSESSSFNSDELADKVM